MTLKKIKGESNSMLIKLYQIEIINMLYGGKANE